MWTGPVAPYNLPKQSLQFLISHFGILIQNIVILQCRTPQLVQPCLHNQYTGNLITEVRAFLRDMGILVLDIGTFHN